MSGSTVSQFCQHQLQFIIVGLVRGDMHFELINGVVPHCPTGFASASPHGVYPCTAASGWPAINVLT